MHNDFQVEITTLFLQLYLPKRWMSLTCPVNAQLNVRISCRIKSLPRANHTHDGTCSRYDIIAGYLNCDN